MHALLAACGGFLLSTLWFDLMFDVQVLGHAGDVLPDPVLASIAAYYRRVTTEADPMGRLIGVVMLTAIIGTGITLRHPARRGLHWAALLACTAPVVLALAKVFPDAVRLGTRADSLGEQTALARAIFAGHAACLVSIVVFILIQVLLARDASRPE